MRAQVVLAAVALLQFGLPAPAGATDARLTFTTLGTNSGPIPRADRSETANLVRYGDQLILTDVGDGAAEQLSRLRDPRRGQQPPDGDL